MHSVGLLGFSAAAFSSAFWPALPTPLLVAVIAVLTLPVAAVCGRIGAVTVLGVGAGILSATAWGHLALAHRLPADLDKTDYRVQGTVVGLPSGDAGRVRLQLAVKTLTAAAGGPGPPLEQLQLSWQGAPPLQPGETWQLDVRLRHPRGLSNPGGFDYAAWLLARHVSATGYVRSSAANRRLATATGAGIDRWRFRLRAHLRRLPLSAEARGFLAALSLGESRELSPRAWRALQVTGTLHLMVVSGQHIALVAGFAFAIGAALGRVPALAGCSLPARYLGIAAAATAAPLYAGLAGASVSTVRALVMVAVVMLAALLRRRLTAATAISWALAAIAATDPLAVLAPGFWLSFGAVTALLWYFSPRPQTRGWWQFAPAQAVVFCALAGWLALFLAQVPLLAPLANLVAVPWISVLVLPLCLLGVVLEPIAPPLATGCWWLAGSQLEAFARLLFWFADLCARWQWQPQSSGRTLLTLALLVGGALVLAPRGVGLRAPGWILLTAVALARDATRPPLAVTVLDVGQGLAAVVETRDSVTVYDTGPAFSERFDAGSAIVAPYLRQRGWRRLDTLVISHADGDHSGGAAALVEQFPPARLLTGQPLAIAAGGAERCRAGDHWRRDGVDFRVLHPPPGYRGGDNDQSCVLLLAHGPVRVLLSGDIEVAAEQRLLATGALTERVDLLVAPHHGSDSSSSPAFVAAVAPREVVFTAGYRHHFGHPHARVTARYRALGARLWNTALSGAIRFEWGPAGELSVSAQRERSRRYWD